MFDLMSSSAFDILIKILKAYPALDIVIEMSLKRCTRLCTRPINISSFLSLGIIGVQDAQLASELGTLRWSNLASQVIQRLLA